MLEDSFFNATCCTTRPEILCSERKHSFRSDYKTGPTALSDVHKCTIGEAVKNYLAYFFHWGGALSPPGKSQNCTGQKCTEHELVLLMFFVLKCLDDLLWGFKMPLVGLLWLLVRHQINSVENKMLKAVVKSAQSTSWCFYFNSHLGWPKSLLEL